MSLNLMFSILLQLKKLGLSNFSWVTQPGGSETQGSDPGSWLQNSSCDHYPLLLLLWLRAKWQSSTHTTLESRSGGQWGKSLGWEYTWHV